MGKFIGGALLVLVLIALSIFAMDALNGGTLFQEFKGQIHLPGPNAPRF